MFSSAHQIRFVVKPPPSTTHSLGRPVHNVEVPALAAASLIGLPAVSAKEKHALMIPENVATRMPFRKLNSAIIFFFCASGICLFLVHPARAAIAMPNRHTATPASVTWPGVEQAISPMLEPTGRLGMNCLKIGGTSVPRAAQ
jgi:hypothetical protein